ncbi:carbon-nitrogen hydrolase [Phaeosphaeriaceae sp. SRC1lsM3a]|nr:carbon-nitrogen hydrolase [Stagonospora sp. SRC1lsM3a]
MAQRGSSSQRLVRIGAVQAEPAWQNLQRTVDKTVTLIQEASAKGVNVLGFPEVWIPGYPWSIWAQPVYANSQLITAYFDNSMAIDSPQMRQIQNAVKEAGIFVVLGFSERSGGSLYISQAYINEQGEIVNHRRKIKPTHVERSIWGEGQAESLKTVVPSSFGRIGALSCWEHLQPLLRYHEYSQGVDIHVGSWPLIWPVPGKIPGPGEGPEWPFCMTAEGCKRATQFMAIEGACFTMISTQVIKDVAANNLGGFPHVGKAPTGGFAMIYGPDGGELVEPMAEDEEGVLVADVDLRQIGYARQAIDVVGHYARPDLLSLTVNSRVAKHVNTLE